MLGKELDQARIVSKNIYRPRLDLRTHAFVEVLDLERHAAMLARVLTKHKANAVTPNVGDERQLEAREARRKLSARSTGWASRFQGT
jgi:hypothetical protein